MCQMYRPGYPGKRQGECELSNVYGDLGCNFDRGEWCAGPSVYDVEECECPRCDGTGYEEDYDCRSHESQGECDPNDPDWRPPRNCSSCRLGNSFGQHGCPRCLD